MDNPRDTIRHLLRKHWGHESFRELQEEIIMSVIEGHDTLGLLPTGGGKSITFQIPALYFGGITLVVTPLVSLMKDQVDNLQRIGLRAVYMHSAMSYKEMKHAWDKLINTDNCHFLYVSPERLANDHFCQQLGNTHKVRMVVVDEAHCISQWGYDFRPSYLNIARLRRYLPSDIRFMALTASATPRVVDDICDTLRFRGGKVFRKSFGRDNISYVVRRTEDKEDMILRVLRAVPGSAIVYVRSRNLTVEIATRLQTEGISAEAFHAGMPYEVKEQRQQLWKKDKIRVMVATNAFGMGIDKPDVRSVIHYAMPSSMEEYYQEAGRAGRDGQMSYAVALVGRLDKALMRRRIAEAFPRKERILKIYELVCNFLSISLEEGENRIFPFDIKKFCHVFRMQERQVITSLGILGASGYLEYIEDTDSSAKVMFVCEREELYHFDERGLPGADRVIERLLRGYTGLFSDYVPINESGLAYETGLDVERVHELLVALARSGVLSYIPRRMVPCIFMARRREEPQYLIIPKSVYEDRRDALESRIDSVLDYCSDAEECRQRRLLEYFGEKDTRPCGHCDQCRKAKARHSRRLSDKELTDYIFAALRQQPRGIDCAGLLDSLPAYRDRIKVILTNLEDEGFIVQSHNHHIALP